MERKAFVLLSGGMDSTTCLFKAIHDFFPEDPGLELGYGDPHVLREALNQAASGQTVPGSVEIPWVEAVSIDYGQKHIKETEYAHQLCDRLGIKHTTLDVGKLLAGKSVMLTRDSDVEVPDISYADIKGVSPTYVPFRNGLMLSAIVAHAQKYVNEQIDQHITNVKDGALGKDAKEWATLLAKDLTGVYFGAHSEDAANWAYPDCTPEFIGAMANAIYIGSYMTIRLYTPIQWLTKKEIVLLGTKLGVPFENTWSCYKGEDLQCGTCPTCQSRREAFELAEIDDPTTYASKRAA
jgi:7-cyano-7-deazaguanine synthase